jgi:ornithine racemase
MTAPRLEVDLTRIEANTRSLVGQLDSLGIAVTAVTKATL